MTHHLRQMPVPLLLRWLPRRLSLSLFRQQVPAFGLKGAARLWLVLCLVALASLGLREAYPKFVEEPPPTPRARSLALVDVRPALQAVTADGMLRHARELSSDAYEGRGPGTRGEQLTVKYLIEQMQRIGLKPGNPDGTYVQKVPLAGMRGNPTMSFTVGDKEMRLENLKDYVAASRRYEPQVNVEDSDVVFVGYGVTAPEYGWDDYKGLDVKGKTIVMLINDPAVPDLADPTQLDERMFKGRGMTYYGRWTYKYEEATRRGAAAAVIVHEEGPAGYPFEVVSGSWGRENFDIVSPDKNAGRVGVESWITLARAKELFAAAGQDFDTLKRAAVSKDFRPVALAAKMDATVRNTLREVLSSNVIGRFDGSDPELRNEYVVYTAHWDHLGKDDVAQGDGIFNGAVDNALGVAQVLEIAEALTALPALPKRSVLFLFTTGQEKGLLGAKHYASNPLYPLARTLADINVDGPNQWGHTSDIIIIGDGNSTLDDMARAVAEAQGRTVSPDLDIDRGFYYRADQFEFAKIGVPALYLDVGFNYVGKSPEFGQQKREEYSLNDYHKPSDEIKPDWDLSGAVEDAQLLLAVGYRIAQGDRYPEWKPGTEFKAARDKSLQATR